MERGPMRRMRAIAASLLLTLPLVAAERTAHAVIAPDVTIDMGVIHGIDTGQTLEWRGVPYAAAPIGNLRWRRPAPVTPWGGVRNATQFGPPCIQPVSPTDTIGSEDCLYLNVFPRRREPRVPPGFR